MGDVADFSQLHGRRHRQELLRDAEGGDRRGARVRKAEIVAGGDYDDSEGYFVEPTVIQTEDPATGRCRRNSSVRRDHVRLRRQALERHARARRRTARHTALTGAVFADDRYAVEEAHATLRYAAGNFYVNDKPTGAVVGQQPFGGARASGTNDKAGSMWNLIRWVSPRTMKETFVPPTDYRYPFMGSDGVDRRSA